MLTMLRIKNLALVEDLSLDLEPGLNAITGETGAGKSIIIGALNLLLGERADRTLIRAGCDACTVEAVFDLGKLAGQVAAFLEENGLEPCEAGQLVVKRTFSLAGANRQFVNGSPTPLATLEALGEWLVDIHGPHDHQSLLHPARQLDILDAFGKLEEPRAAFATLVRRRGQLLAEKAALVVDDRTLAQRLDMLRHQVHEIQSAQLQPGEETALEAEYQRASNAARLIELSQGALGLLAENEPCLQDQLGTLGRTLSELQRLDPPTGALIALHEQACGSIRDLQNELRQYTERLELDPARLQQLEERLNLLQSLKRKYGPSVAAVIDFGQQADRDLRALEQRETEMQRIEAALAEVDRELIKAGKDLTARRKKVVPQISRRVSQQLNELGFAQGQLEVGLKSQPGLVAGQDTVPASGFDTVEFQFAPNPGEPARPLRAIASSGEMARVMLALKTVLAAEDRVPVLIFDEVDANVGGETARAVGDKMRQISRQRQVLCITHLAPVAAFAPTHFAVTKEIRDGRTVSHIDRLATNDRVLELARMLGGGRAAEQHARALLK